MCKRAEPAPNLGASPRRGKNLAQCDWHEQSKFVATNYACSYHTEGERNLTYGKESASIGKQLCAVFLKPKGKGHYYKINLQCLWSDVRQVLALTFARK